MTARVAAIVPVLDEAERVGPCVRRLAELGVDHVVVVDGGSHDATVRIARAQQVGCTLHVMRGRRGRGPQLNAGAAAASDADVLWFVHADVTPPDDALHHVRTALADSLTVAGAFRTRTVPDVDGPCWVRPLLPLADTRSSYTRLPYGDQGLFVRADAFHAVGGFPDQPLFEDVELARRLCLAGRVRIVDAAVHVSGRRYLAAPLRAAMGMNLFPILYGAGVSSETIAAWYEQSSGRGRSPRVPFRRGTSRRWWRALLPTVWPRAAGARLPR